MRQKKDGMDAEFFDEGLVSVKDAARFLGLGITKVYAFMGEGELAFCKLGRARRIKREDLRAFVQRRTQGGYRAGDQAAS